MPLPAGSRCVKNVPVYSAKFLVTAYTSILAPLLPLILADMRLSLTEAGALISFFSLFNALPQPLFGWAQGRVGYRSSLCLAPLWVGAFMGAAGWAQNFVSLMACLLLAGLGISVFHPASFTAIAGGEDASDRSMRISLLLLAASLGFVLGPFFITSFVAHFGMKNLPWVAVPGGAVTLLLLGSFRQGGAAAPHPPRRSGASFQEILFQVLPFFIFALTITVSAMNLYSFVPMVLKERGAPLEVIGLSMSSFALGCSLGPLGGSVAARRLGRRQTLLLSSAFSIIFLILFFPAQEVPFAGIAILLLLGAALMLPASVLIDMAQEAFPSHVGAVSSLLSGFAWGCGGVLVILFAGIAEAVGIENMIGALALLLSVNLALVFAGRPFRSWSEKMPPLHYSVGRPPESA